MPPSMSNTPGPVARPSTTSNGRRASVPSGEHRVVVAEQEDLRLAAADPVHVRPDRAVDERRRPTQPAFDDGREHLGRRREGVDVERRRLHLHELAEIGEHVVDRELGVVGDALHSSTVILGPTVFARVTPPPPNA